MAFVPFKAGRFRPDPKPEKKEKVKNTKIKPKSDKRSKEDKIYSALRKVFLEGKFCPITGEQATQVHHKKGRIGKLYLDIRFWLAVSDTGHKKIELNPEWAKKMGYSLERLTDDTTDTDSSDDHNGSQELPAGELE